VVDGAVAYIATSEGRIHAADLQRPGSIRWTWQATGPTAGITGAIARGARGVYATDATGDLLCVDAATGALRWRADLPGTAPAGVVALADQIQVGVRHRTTPPTATLLAFDEGED
jgi:outer membrane protein assembly factor BamB